MRAWRVTKTEPSPFQEAIIADGVITEAEYLGAVQAAADCMTDRGWEVSEPERRLDGVTYAFATGSSAAASESQQDRSDRNERDFNECAAGTIDPLEMAYFDLNLYTGAERSAAYGDLADCLQDSGVDGEVDGRSREEISILLQDSAASDAAYLCLERAARLFPALGEG